MSVATEIQELTQNTAELDGIRTSMREKLVAKGVDASTHNFADFPNDVESIPSPQQILVSKNYTSYFTASGGEDIDTVFYENTGRRIYPLRNGNDVTLNANGLTKFRAVERLRLTADVSSSYWGTIMGAPNNSFQSIMVWLQRTNNQNVIAGGWLGYTADRIAIPQLNQWYYFVLCCDYSKDSKVYKRLYDDNGTLLQEVSGASSAYTSNNRLLFGAYSGNADVSLNNVDIDLSQTVFEINGSTVWGKFNSKTENMGIIT